MSEEIGLEKNEREIKYKRRGKKKSAKVSGKRERERERRSSPYIRYLQLRPLRIDGKMQTCNPAKERSFCVCVSVVIFATLGLLTLHHLCAFHHAMKRAEMTPARLVYVVAFACLLLCVRLSCLAGHSSSSFLDSSHLAPKFIGSAWALHAVLHRRAPMSSCPRERRRTWRRLSLRCR